MGSNITDALNTAIDREWTTPKQLALVSGMSRSTIGNWLHGTNEPTLNAVQGWLCHHPNRRFKQLLLDAVTMGAARLAKDQISLNALDINGDGVVDIEDAMDSAIKTAGDAHTTLAVIREATSDGKITHDQFHDIAIEISNVRRDLDIALNICAESVERRSKCNPTPAVTGPTYAQGVAG